MNKKFLFIWVLLMVVLQGVKSQSLEGTWIGYFDEDGVGGKTTYALIFFPTNDTTYKAYSITYFKTGKVIDTAVCEMNGWMAAKDLLHLEEIMVLKNTGGFATGCKQIMELEYGSKDTKEWLKGKWWSKEILCGTGRVQLTRNKTNE